MLDKIYLDDGQIILDASSVSPSDIHTYLVSIGCKYPEKLESIAGQIYLMTSEAWQGRYIPFFVSVDSLWHTLRAKDQEPEHYFVIGISSQDMDALRDRLKFYFALRSMLKGLCHHEGDDAQPMKYIFFSSKESYLTKLEIPYAMSIDDFLSINFDGLAISRAETLKSAAHQDDDVHCDERKHVMREALVEFFKDEESRNFGCLMSGVKDFYQAYSERYKVYVSKFSVNKILSEIENERVSFLCKIQDAIMSQQTKAFAIPGGVVAVGAILRFSKNSWDFLIIFTGLLITTWMISSLNKNVTKHIDLLGEEFKKSVSKYNDVIVGIEDVRAEIERSRVKLDTSSVDAKKKLSSLTRIAWMILVLVTLLLIERSERIISHDLDQAIKTFSVFVS